MPTLLEELDSLIGPPSTVSGPSALDVANDTYAAQHPDSPDMGQAMQSWVDNRAFEDSEIEHRRLRALKQREIFPDPFKKYIDPQLEETFQAERNKRLDREFAETFNGVPLGEKTREVYEKKRDYYTKARRIASGDLDRHAIQTVPKEDAPFFMEALRNTAVPLDRTFLQGLSEHFDRGAEELVDLPINVATGLLPFADEETQKNWAQYRAGRDILMSQDPAQGRNLLETGAFGAARSAPVTLASAAVQGMTGGTGALALAAGGSLIGLQSAEEAYTEYRKAGYGPTESRVAAATTGLVEGAIEEVLSPLKTILPGMAIKRGPLRTQIGSVAKEYFKRGLTEEGENITQSASRVLAEYAMQAERIGMGESIPRDLVPVVLDKIKQIPEETIASFAMVAPGSAGQFAGVAGREASRAAQESSDARAKMVSPEYAEWLKKRHPDAAKTIAESAKNNNGIPSRAAVAAVTGVRFSSREDRNALYQNLQGEAYVPQAEVVEGAAPPESSVAGGGPGVAPGVVPAAPVPTPEPTEEEVQGEVRPEAPVAEREDREVREELGEPVAKLPPDEAVARYRRGDNDALYNWLWGEDKEFGSLADELSDEFPGFERSSEIEARMRDIEERYVGAYEKLHPRAPVEEKEEAAPPPVVPPTIAPPEAPPVSKPIGKTLLKETLSPDLRPMRDALRQTGLESGYGLEEPSEGHYLVSGVNPRDRSSVEKLAKQHGLVLDSRKTRKGGLRDYWFRRPKRYKAPSAVAAAPEVPDTYPPPPVLEKPVGTKLRKPSRSGTGFMPVVRALEEEGLPYRLAMEIVEAPSDLIEVYKVRTGEESGPVLEDNIVREVEEHGYGAELQGLTLEEQRAKAMELAKELVILGSNVLGKQRGHWSLVARVAVGKEALGVAIEELAEGFYKRALFENPDFEALAYDAMAEWYSLRGETAPQGYHPREWFGENAGSLYASSDRYRNLPPQSRLRRFVEWLIRRIREFAADVDWLKSRLTAGEAEQIRKFQKEVFAARPSKVGATLRKPVEEVPSAPEPRVPVEPVSERAPDTAVPPGIAGERGTTVAPGEYRAGDKYYRTKDGTIFRELIRSEPPVGRRVLVGSVQMIWGEFDPTPYQWVLSPGGYGLLLPKESLKGKATAWAWREQQKAVEEREAKRIAEMKAHAEVRRGRMTEVLSGIEGVRLWADEGKTKEMTDLAAEMATVTTPKAGVPKGPKTGAKVYAAPAKIISDPKASVSALGAFLEAPKERVKARDHSKYVFVDAEKAYASDGRRLGVVLGDFSGMTPGPYTVGAKGSIRSEPAENVLGYDPNYLIPRATGKHIAIDDIAASRRRVAQATIFAGSPVSRTKKATLAERKIAVVLNKDGTLGFAGRDPGSGQTEVNVQPGYKFLAGVRSQYLEDAFALAQDHGDTSLKMWAPKDDKPILIVGGRTTSVIMPVKLDPDELKAIQPTEAGPKATSPRQQVAEPVPPGRAEVSEPTPAPNDSIPEGSPYKQETYALRKVYRRVSLNKNDRTRRVYEVSFDPAIVARMGDKEAPKAIRSIKEARSINASPTRVADWARIYAKAERILGGALLRKPAETGKLVGVEVLMMTTGCQRALATMERVENGILPSETRIEACLAGSCWANFTLPVIVYGSQNFMEVRDLGLTTKEDIDRFASNPRNIELLNKTFLIREGYAGDSSHLFATGLAEHWVKAMKNARVTTKTVFISASYAPVTEEQYKAMLPYKNLFELHFSVSGWFHKNEIMLRLAEWKTAKDLGLPVHLRVITNVSRINDLDMVNEDWMYREMEKLGVQQNDVLETPYHDDRIRRDSNLWRSQPSGKWKHVCCENHACAACREWCLTKLAGRNSVENNLRPNAAAVSDAVRRKDLWTEPQQEITSEETSVATVPHTFNFVKDRGGWKSGTRNADIGAGRFVKFSEALKSVGVENIPYDPFNLEAGANYSAVQGFARERADTATVNNVLNVIAESGSREVVIAEAADAIKPSGTAYFLVWEGNGSGVGARTTKGWQENRKPATYLDEIRNYFGDVQLSGKVIVARLPKPPTFALRPKPPDTPEVTAYNPRKTENPDITLAMRRRFLWSGTPKAPWADDPAETESGKKLLEDLKKPTVGRRTIMQFVADLAKAEIRVGRSQLSGTVVSRFYKPSQMIRTRSGDWQYNYHEAGRAIWNLIGDASPKWAAAHKGYLEQLTELPDSASVGTTVDRGMGEWVRRFITDYGSLPTNLHSLVQTMERVAPDVIAGLRDAHRAYQLHKERPLKERAKADQADRPPPMGTREQIEDALWTVAHALWGPSAIIHRLERRMFQSIAGGRSALAGLRNGAQILAREVSRSLKDTPGDVGTAWHSTTLVPVEVGRLLHGAAEGQAGVRVLATAGRELANLEPSTKDSLRDKGFDVPDRAAGQGNYVYLTDYDYESVKREIGKEDWEAFKEYGQWKTALHRATKEAHAYPGLSDGTTKADIKSMIDDFESKHPGWEREFKRVQHLYDQMLLIPVMTGEITPSEAVAMKDKWEDYWSLPRQLEGIGGRRGGAGPVPSSGLFRAHGSEKEFLDADEAFARRARSTLEAYYANRVRWAVLEAQNVISRDRRIPFEVRKIMARVMVPLSLERKKVATLSVQEQQRIVALGMNTMKAEELGVDVDDLDMDDKVNPDDITLDLPGFPVFRAVKPRSAYVVGAHIPNLGLQYYEVRDPFFYHLFARSRAPNEVVALASGTLSGVGRPWGTAITQSAPFALRNVPRDVITALAFGKSLVPGFYHARGLLRKVLGRTQGEWDTLTRALQNTNSDAHATVWQKFEDAMARGILIPGYADMTGLERVAAAPGQVMSSALKPIEVLNWVTAGPYLAGLSETSAREGAYGTAIAEGASQEAAQRAAAEITGTFGYKPGEPNVAAIVKPAVFLNPSLQILRGILWRMTAADPKERMLFMALRIPMLSVLGAVGATLGYLLLRALWPDDRDRERRLNDLRDRPEEDRFRYFWLGNLIRLPFERGVGGAAFSWGWNLAERTLLEEKTDQLALAKRVLRNAVDLPGIGEWMQPQIKVAYELYRNWAFYMDRNIVPPWLIERFPHEPEKQYTTRTPQPYRKIGEALRVSPMKVQYAVRQGVARQADELVSFFGKIAEGKSVKPTEMPVIGSLMIERPTGWGSKSVQQLSELDLKYEKALRDLRESANPDIRAAAASEARKTAKAHAYMVQVERYWKAAKQERDSPKGDLEKVRQLEDLMRSLAAEGLKS